LTANPPLTSTRCESRRVHEAEPAAIVRRAGADDSAALARLRWLWRTTERGEHGLSQPDFEAAFARWWAERRSRHVGFIAKRGDDAVGMAWLAVFERVPQPRHLERLAGNMQSVFVLEEFRNHGIGRRLVEAVIAEARSRGLGYLIVHPSQRAYPLYERLGFAPTNQLLHLDLDALAATAPTE
jgi:GNAT superfamily N-acetyltransferase